MVVAADFFEKKLKKNRMSKTCNLTFDTMKRVLMIAVTA